MSIRTDLINAEERTGLAWDRAAKAWDPSISGERRGGAAPSDATVGPKLEATRAKKVDETSQAYIEAKEALRDFEARHCFLCDNPAGFTSYHLGVKVLACGQHRE